MKRVFLFFITILFLITSEAQQDAQLSMYMFNLLHFNPAYAGYHKSFNATAIYRHQWDNVNGAPRTISLTAHNKTKNENYNWGVAFKGDKMGLWEIGSLDGIFCYKIRLKKENSISLAASAGVSFIQFKSENSKMPIPENIQLGNQNKFAPNFGAGIFITGPKYFFGFSVPHIILTNYNSTNNGFSGGQTKDTFASQFNHLFAQGGLMFNISEDVKLRPSFMFKYVTNSPPSIDVNMSVLLKYRFWVGMTYRLGGNIYNDNGERIFGEGNAIVGMVKFLCTQQIEIGYAYDYSLSKLVTLNRGTHELMFNFIAFKTKKVRFITPRYVKYF